MDVFWDGILAAACVLIMGLILCWTFGLMLRPLPSKEARVLISGRGEGEHLEQLVRALVWLRGLGLLQSTIMIVDVDLTPSGRELALRLAARWPDVLLWPVSDLSEYFRRI